MVAPFHASSSWTAVPGSLGDGNLTYGLRMAANRGRRRCRRVPEVIGLVRTHRASGCRTVGCREQGCREQDGVKLILSIFNIFCLNLTENSAGWNWIQFRGSIPKWAVWPNSRNPNEFPPILTKQTPPKIKFQKLLLFEPT
jgi:hypothetical protein